MRTLPLRLPPAIYILIFSQFHMANLMNAIGLSMFAVEGFGAGDFAVGVLGSILMFSYGAFAWLGGLLADRFPKRALIPFGLSVLAVIFWIVPYAGSLVQMTALGAFCSVMFVTIMPSHFSLIGESVAPHRVSRFLSFNAMVLVLAGMTGAFLVGRLFEAGGPVRAFHTSSMISAGTMVFVLLFAPRNENREAEEEHRLDPENSPVTLRAHPHARAFLYGGLTLNFLGFFVGIMHQYFVVRLAVVPELEMTLSQQSNVQALRMLCAGSGYVLGVVWTGWHWKTWPFWSLGALMLTVTLAAGVAPNPVWLAAAIGAGGFGSAMCNQMSLYYAIGGGAVRGGRGAGLNETSLALGAGSGPLVGGVLAGLAGTPRGALFAPLLPIAVCVVLWMRILPRAFGEPDSSIDSHRKGEHAVRRWNYSGSRK